MNDNTLLKRTIICALAPLRAFSDATGENRALAMITVPLFLAMMGLDPNAGGRNFLCLSVMAAMGFCLLARHKDGKGHRAMRKALKAERKATIIDPFVVEALTWLRLPVTASVDDVRASCRAMMKRDHTDSGGAGNIDMAELIKFREAVTKKMANQPSKTARLTASDLLSLYRHSAGCLGPLWGHLFPTAQLRSLGFK